MNPQCLFSLLVIVLTGQFRVIGEFVTYSSTNYFDFHRFQFNKCIVPAEQISIEAFRPGSRLFFITDHCS